VTRSHRYRLLPLAALVPLLLVLAFPAFAASGRPPAGARPTTLVEVIDGHTIDVLVNDKVESVHYMAIKMR
jgi:cytochrome c oxidase assembly factor CtaG